jgi:hypothetical protein
LKILFCIAEEALHALDRYRLLGRELEVEFARGDRKSRFLFFLILNLNNHFRLLAPSEMRAREKESRHSGGRGGENRRDRSRR